MRLAEFTPNLLTCNDFYAQWSKLLHYLEESHTTLSDEKILYIIDILEQFRLEHNQNNPSDLIRREDIFPKVYRLIPSHNECGRTQDLTTAQLAI